MEASEFESPAAETAPAEPAAAPTETGPVAPEPTEPAAPVEPEPTEPEPAAPVEPVEPSPSEPSAATSSSDETETAEQASEPAGEEGLLAGTTAEQEPGTGSGGSHPAPAVMRDPETGALHSAGMPPSGIGAGEEAPAGDASDLTSESDFLTPEAKEELEAVHEPEQAETERPDLGTP